MQFVCMSLAFLPMDSANLQAIKAFGKGGTFLVIEVVKTVLGLAVLAVSMILTAGNENSLYIVLAAQVGVNLVTTYINAIPNAIISELNSSVNDIIAKYDNPILTLDTDIAKIEESLSEMLNNLTGSDFDMEAIQQFKILLGGKENE